VGILLDVAADSGQYWGIFWKRSFQKANSLMEKGKL